MSLRFPVEPMKALLGVLPSATDDDNWAYELKFDGYRTLAFVDDGRLRLQSSHLIDVTAKYPELADFPRSVNAGRAVLDGELVVLDADGKPRFELIQRHETQVHFYPFDVLSIDGTDTIALGYEHRRSLLAQLVEPGPNWITHSHRIGGGAELLEATRVQGLEGVMAKRLGSTYLPGKRSPGWRKVKNRRRARVAIGGFTPGSGNRASTFGSLLVGMPRPDGTLRFAGGVGSGFTQATLERLRVELDRRRTTTCPFQPEPPREYRRDARWVEPDLVADIEMTEITNEGYVRQASFTGLASQPPDQHPWEQP